MNIVEAQGLRKYYGKENNLVKAIDGVDFGIRRGEVVAIVGMSGSGKWKRKAWRGFLHMGK